MSTMYCRITGSSRSLPRPNYFPLLPPISPADAKKLFCKITGKSWNLPPHHYIPVFSDLRPSQPTCNVTRGNLEMFKVFTPFIPDGSKKFSDSASKFVYVIDGKFALLLPDSIETCIQDGRIGDMMMSRDETELEIKLNNRRETLKLLEVSLEAESGLSLKQGKGPSSTKQRRSLRTRTKIFEDKESLAEQEEKKAVERIEPKLEVVESVKKRLEQEVAESAKQRLELEAPPCLPLKRSLSRGLSIDYGEEHGPKVGDQEPSALQPLTLAGQAGMKVPKIVPGQIVKTSSQTKFVPGQFLHTTEGYQFIPGQVEIIEGEARFVPGQVISTGHSGPTFIPGQVVTINGESKFVPGQVVEINGEGKFVPGRVKEEAGRIRFIPGEVIDTEEGLKFVCEGQVTVDGEWEFQFQGLEVGAGMDVGVDLQNFNGDHRFSEGHNVNGSTEKQPFPEGLNVNGTEKQRFSESIHKVSEDLRSISEGEESGTKSPKSVSRKNTLDLKLVVGDELKELSQQDKPALRRQAEVLSVTPAIGEIFQESGEEELWADEVRLKMRVHESGPTTVTEDEGGPEAHGDRLTPTCCVILKNDLEIIIPREGASKILSGEARYSIIDETGVRFFEPKVRATKTQLKSFTNELMQGIEFDVHHDVKITEITTPDTPEDTSYAMDEGFRKATSVSRNVEVSSTSDFELDLDLDLPIEQILDSSVAKSKLSIKQVGKRRATSPRSSSNNIPESGRNEPDLVAVREAKEATIAELVETEEEFIRDIRYLLSNYYSACDLSSDKTVSESRDTVFGNLVKIAEFHEGLLAEGLKSNSESSKMLGRCFLRLERDFDSHAKYIEDEASAEQWLNENPRVMEFFEDISVSIGSPKSLLEQLRLPNQRLNDYQVILSELVGFERELGTQTGDLEKALELMKTLPQKTADEKFLNSIEGYKGSVKGLGRLIGHDWFSLTDITGRTHERYLFLFKGRILVTKVKRITEDRSVFILKDVLRLPDLEIQSEGGNSITLSEPSTGGKYVLEHSKVEVKDFWLGEIKNFAGDRTVDRTRRQDSVTVDGANSSDDDTGDRLSDKPHESRAGRKVSVDKVGAKVECAETIHEESKDVEESSTLVRKSSVLTETAKAEEAYSRQSSLISEKAEPATKAKTEEVLSRQSSVLSEKAETKAKAEEAYSRQSSVLAEDAESTKAKAENLSRQSSVLSEKAETKALEGEAYSRQSSVLSEKSDTKTEILSRGASVSNPNADEVLSRQSSVLCENAETKAETLSRQESASKAKAGEVVSRQSSVLPEDAESTQTKAEVLSRQSSVLSEKAEAKTKAEESYSRQSSLISEKAETKAETLSRQGSVSKAKAEEVLSRQSSVISERAETKEETLSRQGSVSKAKAEESYRRQSSILSEKAETNAETLSRQGSVSKGKAEEGLSRQSSVLSEKAETKAEALSRQTSVRSEKVEVKVTADESNGSGSRRSSIVNLRRDSSRMDVEKRPKLSVAVKSVQCEPGDKAVLAASFTSTNPCTVTWLRDNKPLDDKLADRLKITNIGNDYTVDLLNCREDDSGLYTARCTNEFGSISSSGILTVHEFTAEERAQRIADNSPYFNVKFLDVEVLEDTVACFMIEVKGDPLPKIKMFKDGQPLQQSDRVKLESAGLPGHYDLLINHMQESDAGIYRCTAMNIYGDDSFSAELKVVEEKDVFHGLEEAPLDFAWFRDGRPFTPEERFKVMFKDEEDTLALLFQHVTPEDAGLYTCVASTSSGRISCSAELTVKGAIHQLLKEPLKPCIKTKLEPTEFNSGGTAMLEIKTEGYPKPTTAWFKDGVEIKPNEKYRLLCEDEESTALIIKNVELGDAGQYSVIASNDLGEDESACSVTIKSPPKFTKKMDDFECLVGTDIEMEIRVEGFPEPDIKLYKDGIEIRKDTTHTITSSGSSHTIKIKSVEKTSSGAYSAVASNSVGQMSCFWSLSVNSPAKIVTKLEKMEKEVGEEVIFEVRTEGETEEVVWKINEKVVDTKKYKITSSEGKHTLTMSKLARSDSATISCVAKNKYGADQSSAELLIKRKPEITKKLKPVVINLGETAEYSIKVDAYPEPKIKWFLDGLAIDSKKYGHEGDEYRLKLPNVEASGNVKVKVENDYGFDEDSAELTVKCKPSFAQGLKDVSVLESESLDMKIILKGTPTPSLKMFHNGSEVSADARVKITKESTETYHMTFNVVLPSDGGDWTLKAENECGEVESRCKITVEGKPIFEKKLSSTIEVVESESVELSVTLKGNPEPVITWILNNEELQISKHVQITTNGSTTNETFESKLIINNVTMEEAGELKVLAVNKHGVCETSGLLSVISLADLKSPKLVGELGNATLTKGDSSVLKAVVKGNPQPTGTWFKDGKALGPGTVVGEEYSLKLSNIEESTAGEYKLVAKNEHGEISALSKVDVIYKPEVTGFKDVTVSPGDECVLEAKVRSNPEPSKLEWSKDGTPLQKGATYGDGVAKLTVGPAEKDTEGVYKLKVTNAVGETEVKAKVAVKTDPPVFLKTLVNQELKDGEELVLKVKVSGTPIPSLAWTKDGVEITDGITEEDGLYTLSYAKAGIPETGKYKIVATNSSGTAESEAGIKLEQSKPKFLKSLPRRVSISELDDLVLKAKVDGSPLPQVAWLKDGVKLEPSDRVQIQTLPDGTCILTIREATPMDRGAYSISIENPNGETASACNVEVAGKHRKPEFLENLCAPSHAAYGQPFKLTAKISGHPMPEVKWLKDGKVVRPSAGILSEIKPDGSISLEILSAKPADAGKYSLCLSNDRGELSQEAQVAVDEPLAKPKFSKPMADTTVVEGFPIELEAVLAANPPPLFSLTKDGEPTGIEVKVLPRQGSLRASICIPNAAELHAGKYELLAENSEGATRSQAVISVMPKSGSGEKAAPEFLTGLRGVKVDEGEELKLVAVVSGNPLPEIEWTKDGALMGGGLFDGKHATLRIPEASMQSAGVYSCNLNNELGSASSQGEVSVKKVYEKPKFTNRFADVQQLPTRDCKFGAKISGIPYPSVKWTKDGLEIQPSDKFGIDKKGDVVSLVVRNCTDADKGRYSCIIENLEGSDKCEADLDVVKEIEKKPRTEEPYFLKKISSTDVYDGMAAKFTACIEGFPEPEFEWFKDDVKLSPSDRFKFEREGAGLLRLIIKKVTEEDVGKYRLLIFNSVGSAECEANLKFESFETKKRPVPEPQGDYKEFKKSGLPLPLPDKPIISRMSDRNLTLSWRPSLSSAARYPVTYVVEMCEVRDGAEWFEVRRGLRQCVCDIRNLDPWLDYKFRVRVENQYGVSDPSPYAITLRSKFDLSVKPWSPIPTHSIPRDYDLEIPPHEGYTHPPRFLNQPDDTQYGVKGINSKLMWFVYGYPKPEIRFEFNGVDITRDIGGGAWATTYRNNGEVVLFVNRMTENLVGNYRAIATNPLGEAFQDVKLKIAEEPRFILRPKETYIMLRKGGKITAKATGVPTPDIKFYKDWKIIGDSSRLKFHVSEGLDCVTITIELRDSILKDAGLYSISATNLASSSHASFNIIIEESEPDFNWQAYGPPRVIKPRFKGFHEYYDLGDEIGRGTQGITYHAVDRGSGHAYACKYMRGTGPRREWMDNEINIMDGLGHPNLTRLVEWFGEPSGVRVVLEMSSGGDIIQSLMTRRDVDEWEISNYVRQMLLGLEYLHDRNIGHLGLTPFDILMTRMNGRDLRITDFGLSRRIGSKLLPLDYGMPEFVAPEIVMGHGVGLGADIWSIGVITYLLLSGRSLFRGRNDMETLDNIKTGRWEFDDCFSTYSSEARDFLSRLLVFEANGRLDIKSCLSHPWFSMRHTTRVETVTRLTTTYYDDLWGWYSNANCRDIYRRRPLSGAYTHASKMVYPPGDYTPPERSPTREPRDYIAPEANYPRPKFDTEIGAVSSESHYQSGPDTYLLQLRDADFPARLRQYMKVAAYRSPAMALQLRGAAYDTDRTVIYERRRFTDVMDEEVDDERKNRIAHYGNGSATRRLKHEVGQRMDIQAEAEALVMSKRDGSAPVFRIKPEMIIEVLIGTELVVTVVVDGDPIPVVQWYKNDLVIAETNRLKFVEDKNKFSLSISKMVAYDVGVYKVVARSKNGQATARFRINEVDFLETKRSKDVPELDYGVESSPIGLSSFEEVPTVGEIYRGKYSVILNAEPNILRYSKGFEKEIEIVAGLKHVNLCNVLKIFQRGEVRAFVQEGGGQSVLSVLSGTDYSEQTLCIITGQILDALSYIHWRGYAVLNIEPGNILLNNVQNPVAKLADFSSLQAVSRLGSPVKTFTPIEFTPPELLNSENALHTTDIWNIGIFLYVLLSGHSPFGGETDEDTRSNVTFVQFRFEYLHKDLTQEITRFIMLVFKRSPLKRPSIEECFEHRWFLPSEFMVRKREKSVFKGRLLKDYLSDYLEKRSAWGKDLIGGQLTNGN